MLENFFRRGGIENSKKPIQEDMVSEEMVGEIHPFKYTEDGTYKRMQLEAMQRFEDLGFRKGDKVEVKNPDSSLLKGIIKGIYGFTASDMPDYDSSQKDDFFAIVEGLNSGTGKSERAAVGIEQIEKGLVKKL